MKGTAVNVILVIIDSLRMDHMGCYADCYPEPPKAETPNLDRLAAHRKRSDSAARRSRFGVSAFGGSG